MTLAFHVEYLAVNSIPEKQCNGQKKSIAYDFPDRTTLIVFK